jgi:acyl dehydratase
MHLEDYAVGDRAELGAHRFTAEEIVRFASQYDPQPFHLSEEGAAAGPFGRLAASGWHTCAIWMRLMTEFQRRLARERMEAGLPVGQIGPSPGFRDLRWTRPVYAGDTLTFFAEVMAVRPSESRPAWGVLTGRNTAVNQDGVEVLEFTSTVLVERRAPG